jgi:hypothetical protein
LLGFVFAKLLKKCQRPKGIWKYVVYLQPKFGKKRNQYEKDNHPDIGALCAERECTERSKNSA